MSKPNAIGTPGATQAAPLPLDEIERLLALRSLEILDTPPSESFDRITRLAAALLDIPIVLVSLVDEHRQWFKSCVGLDATETSRGVSFCAHAVYERRPLDVPDALLDPRFAGNPLVTGPPYIRAYLGILCSRVRDAPSERCAPSTPTHGLSQRRIRKARRLRQSSRRSHPHARTV